MQVHSDWYLTPQRAAVHVPTQTAVIADVHLGYNHSRQRKGDAVPSDLMSPILVPLKQLADAGVRRLVVAGDLLESKDQEDPARSFMEELSRIRVKLTAVVPGNHDGDLSWLKDIIPVCTDGFRLGEWTIRHGDQPAVDERVVHGHLHPCVRRLGRNIPSFLFEANRLILPAFSPDAAGVNVNRIDGRDRFACYAIINGGIETIKKNRR